jgi:hypothetical protein
MTNDENLNMLEFVFERDSGVEIEAGYALAGILVIDFPKQKDRDVPERAQQMATPIIQLLAKLASRLPYNAAVYGWKNGIKPPNADELTDDESLMNAWAKNRVGIGVRVSKDGDLPVDSSMKRAVDSQPPH